MVSGEVPFGIIRKLRSGVAVLETYDYGFREAERHISMEELINCRVYDVMRANSLYPYWV
jgi:hypothetical protein